MSSLSFGIFNHFFFSCISKYNLVHCCLFVYVYCAGFSSSAELLMMDLLRPCHFISFLCDFPLGNNHLHAPDFCLEISSPDLSSKLLFQIISLPLSTLSLGDLIDNLYWTCSKCNYWFSSNKQLSVLSLVFQILANNNVIYPFAQARMSASFLYYSFTQFHIHITIRSYQFWFENTYWLYI